MYLFTNICWVLAGNPRLGCKGEKIPLSDPKSLQAAGRGAPMREGPQTMRAVPRVAACTKGATQDQEPFWLYPCKDR